MEPTTPKRRGRPPNKRPEEREEEISKVWELRKAGYTTRMIGQQIGVSAMTVSRHLREAYQHAREEQQANAREVITLELARLDAMMTALWDKAQYGDAKAVDSLLRVMERRAKLLGLDVTQTQKTVAVTVSPEDLARMSDDDINQLLGQFERS